MPPGYPGYAYLCLGVPELAVPLTPWVTVIGSLAWGLWLETALVALGLFLFWLRRALARKEALSLALIVIAALVVSAADDWVAQRNKALCALGIGQHYPPALQEIAQKTQEAIAQANIALGIAACLFLVGTFLTARVFVVGWRERRWQEAR